MIPDSVAHESKIESTRQRLADRPSLIRVSSWFGPPSSFPPWRQLHEQGDQSSDGLTDSAFASLPQGNGIRRHAQFFSKLGLGPVKPRSFVSKFFASHGLP